MKAALNINPDYVAQVMKEECPTVDQNTIDLVLKNIKKGSKEIDEKVSPFYYKWIREQTRKVLPPVKVKYSFI